MTGDAENAKSQSHQSRQKPRLAKKKAEKQKASQEQNNEKHRNAKNVWAKQVKLVRGGHGSIRNAWQRAQKAGRRCANNSVQGRWPVKRLLRCDFLVNGKHSRMRPDPMIEVFKVLVAGLHKQLCKELAVLSSACTMSPTSSAQVDTCLGSRKGFLPRGKVLRLFLLSIRLCVSNGVSLSKRHWDFNTSSASACDFVQLSVLFYCNTIISVLQVGV